MIDEEDILCAPDGGPWKRRLLGYVVPALIAAYAVMGLLNGEIVLLVQHPETFTGLAARALAVCYASAAAFMHFHWGWGLSERLWHRSQRYKYFSLAAFVPFFGLALYLHFALR